MIPGGQCDSPAANAVVKTQLVDRYCGTSLRCVTTLPAVGIAGNAGTVCTNQKPFKLSIKSDAIENTNAAANSETLLVNGVSNNAGFSLGKYFILQLHPLYCFYF